MKLMCPATRLSLGFFASILIIFGLTAGVSAQRRGASSKKPVAKKTESRAKDARKGSKATAKAKDTRRDSKKETARSNSRDKRDNKRDVKSKAESRRIEAERRREEAARRAAALGLTLDVSFVVALVATVRSGSFLFRISAGVLRLGSRFRTFPGIFCSAFGLLSDGFLA